ncbi:Tll0287-like domain-containing protein [Nitrospira sp. Kam-Ns4a]
MNGRVWLGSLTGLMLIGLVCGAAPGYAADEAKTADLLVKLLKAGRMVVSDHQDLINDAGKGDKGFTPQYFEEKWVAKYKEMTKIDLSKPPAGEPGKLLTILLESGKEVVGEAQPLINKPGIGFKGFLPALWGRKAGEKFGQKTGIRLKQTSIHYRFAGNKPDEFESEVLKQFADSGYPKGKEYVKTVAMEGKQVMRYMSPEYAAKSCLACHGAPAGEKDITGMKKEGYREGDLAGAISVIMPVK